MTCNETKNLLNAYVDGELDSAGSLSVENHIQRCTSCLTDMENLRGLSSAIQNGGLRFQAPSYLKRNVQAAIRAANPEVKRSFFDWRWASALASAVLVVVVGFTLTMQRQKSSE
jgi:anti-sigma factor RsiW